MRLRDKESAKDRRSRPLSYRPRVWWRRAGFEPATSRVTGEVPLPAASESLSARWQYDGRQDKWATKLLAPKRNPVLYPLSYHLHMVEMGGTRTRDRRISKELHLAASAPAALWIGRVRDERRRSIAGTVARPGVGVEPTETEGTPSATPDAAYRYAGRVRRLKTRIGKDACAPLREAPGARPVFGTTRSTPTMQP